jgi:sulfoxide reductase catalytic subunit YedY
MSQSGEPPTNEITPPALYFNRRRLVHGGLLAASAAATGWLYRQLNGTGVDLPQQPRLAGLRTAIAAGPGQGFVVDEPKTPLADVTHYNNFYEFTTDKEGVAKRAAQFRTDGWTVTVGGLVHRPKVFDLDGLRHVAALEERVYRMRCVEAWSMVIPWAGYSLSKLLAQVEPLGDARYVAFETLYDPNRMPGQRTDVLQWPYVEGLRMDEAMHPLTLLTTGLYGRELPPQDGAPVRLIVPWKYGFKGIKSIVKITLTATRPATSWNRYAPNEYGFFANVNPTVDHPRWSQATEQRIGELGRSKTLLFNGYADQVAHLYAGMDLRANF